MAWWCHIGWHKSVSRSAQVMALRHQAITWTIVDLSSVRSSDNQPRAISQEISQPLITKISMKITDLKFYSYFSGANELIVVYFVSQILAAVVPKLSLRGAMVRWANTDNGSTDIYHKLWHQRNSYNLVSGISMISLFMVSHVDIAGANSVAAGWSARANVDNAGTNNLPVTKAMLIFLWFINNLCKWVKQIFMFQIARAAKILLLCRVWMNAEICMFYSNFWDGSRESIFPKLLCPRNPPFHFGTLLNVVSWPQFC